VNVLGIPLRIDPSFFIIMVLVAMMGRSSPLSIGSWVAAVFVSVLVHELGHALLAQRFGYRASMVLHGFGGTTYRSGGYVRTTTWREVGISLAGPGAGFVLGAVAIATRFLLADRVPFLHLFLIDVVYCCVVWGFLNLLPMLPLDGGNVMVQLTRRYFPRSPRLPWYVSMGTGLVSGILSLFLGWYWWAFISGQSVYQGWTALRELPASSSPPAPQRRAPAGQAVAFRAREASPPPTGDAEEDGLRAARSAFVRSPDATTGQELAVVFAKARRFSALAAIAAGGDGLAIPAAALVAAADAALAGGVPKSAVELGELAWKRGAEGPVAAIVARAHGRMGAKEEAARWIRNAVAGGVPAEALRKAPELAALADEDLWGGPVN